MGDGEPFRRPARVLDLILLGGIRLAFDDRLLAEYREVLASPKFGFATEGVATLLAYLEVEGDRMSRRGEAHSVIPSHIL